MVCGTVAEIRKLLTTRLSDATDNVEMKFNPFIIIKLVLVIFTCAGAGLTIFMIMQEVKIVGAYLVSGLFILVPGTILYGLQFGFRISEKTRRKQAERQKRITSSHAGLSYQMPLFDVTLLIEWKTIETVIFTDYQSDDHAQFIFHLTQPPILTRAANPWFLNKIFPFTPGNPKEISIEDDCADFHQIPQMLYKYLDNVNLSDLNQNDKKGTLLSSKTTIHNNTIKTEELWKPNPDYNRQQLIFDKYNRAFEQIKQN